MEEVVKAHRKKKVEATVCTQPHNENVETNNVEEQQTVTDVDLPRKRKAKMKHINTPCLIDHNKEDSVLKRKAKMKRINTPCLIDHNKEDSVFQSGPVTRQRTRVMAGPGNPPAYHLDYSDSDMESRCEEQYDSAEDREPLVSSGIESRGEEEYDSAEDVECAFSSGDIESRHQEEHDSDEDDERTVSSERERLLVERFIGGLQTNAQFSAEQVELLKRYSIVFDPDTSSDALVECIAESGKSKYIDNDYSTYWNSFNNNIFTTGKLVIAPRKKTVKQTLCSKILIYYIEQGVVQVTIYKTTRILKDGDFFFVPPGNGFTIANLQDQEAVMVFNVLKIFPVFMES